MAEFLQEAGDAVTQATNEWGQFLSDPKGRAALLSFGLAMMQPTPPGQSTLGHVGQAIGAAGGSLQEQEDRELKAEESASRQDLRESRARELEGRSAAAISRAEAAGSRLRYMESESARRKDRDRTAGLAQIRKDYNAAARLHNEKQKNRQIGTPETPFPEFIDWLKGNPAYLREFNRLSGELAPVDAEAQGTMGDVIPAAAAPASQGAPRGYFKEKGWYEDPQGRPFQYLNGQKVYKRGE